jgi:hypothetical protein
LRLSSVSSPDIDTSRITASDASEEKCRKISRGEVDSQSNRHLLGLEEIVSDGSSLIQSLRGALKSLNIRIVGWSEGDRRCVGTADPKRTCASTREAVIDIAGVANECALIDQGSSC